VAETASGADRDYEEYVETQRLTERDCNSIQCNVVTTYTTLYDFSDTIQRWTLI
jgi:hypothetical protein